MDASSTSTKTLFSILKGVLFAAVIAALPIQTAAGYTIDIYDDPSLAGIPNLATASSIVTPGFLVSSTTSGIIEFDDFGDSTTGNFAVDNPWPIGDTETFVAHVTGTISTPLDALYTFGLNHDDGARLIIDGILVAEADGVTDNRDTIGSINLTAGFHSVEILYFENTVGASLEFYEVVGGRLFLVPSVPEPATLLLFGLGLTALGYSRRRRT